MVSILDVALYRGAKVEIDGRISAKSIRETGLPFLGGCLNCQATIAAYNAYPTTTGYLMCRDCADDSVAFKTVEDASVFIFGEKS